jgi:tRNA pseudouridine55 synthase
MRLCLIANPAFRIISVDGILIIDKPEGWTSHDVVAKLRRILKTKRIGHTGTLDPFATGVLVMLVGKATRLAQFLDKDVKEYEAVVRLGVETDTGDLTGKPTAEFGGRSAEPDEIQEVLKRFRGEIEQVPPMYSAKKIDGKKLYDLARKGIEVERKPVKVNIFDLEMIEPPRRRDAETEKPNSKADNANPQSALRNPHLTDDLGLRVSCSAGTYIRTLAEDIGKALGVGAHLAALRRTGAGKFKIAEAMTIEQIEAAAEVGKAGTHLIPMRKALSHLPEVILTETDLAKVKNGVAISASIESEDVQIVRMTTADGDLAALGQFEKAEKVVRPRIVFSV